eukprot:gene15574-21672_t
MSNHSNQPGRPLLFHGSHDYANLGDAAQVNAILSGMHTPTFSGAPVSGAQYTSLEASLLQHIRLAHPQPGGLLSTTSTNSNSNDMKRADEQAGGSRPPNRSSDSGAYASRHQAAEQRRRARINERLDLLRKIVPHAERSNTASFLEEVVKYVESLKRQVNELEHQSSMPHAPRPQHLNVANVPPLDGSGLVPKPFQDYFHPDDPNSRPLYLGYGQPQQNSYSHPPNTCMPMHQLHPHLLPGFKQEPKGNVMSSRAQLSELASQLGLSAETMSGADLGPVNLSPQLRPSPGQLHGLSMRSEAGASGLSGPSDGKSKKKKTSY